jgi:hypothetical protein
VSERKVWEYPLTMIDDTVLDLPQDAEVLTVQWQHEHPCLWVLVDPTAPTERRVFRIVGTGHPISGDVRYVGTVQLDGGALIFHVFEVDE